MIYYLLKRISKKTGGWCTGMEWRGAYFEKKKSGQPVRPTNINSNNS
jgi:hypothetical protein